MTFRERLLTTVLAMTLGPTAAAAYGVQDAGADFSLFCKDFSGCQGEQECWEAHSRNECKIQCEDPIGPYELDCPKGGENN